MTRAANPEVMRKRCRISEISAAKNRDRTMNDKGNDGQPRSRRTATKIVTAGRDPKSYHGFVNPPVYHASTVLYPNAEDFLAHRARYQYGRRGTPTTEALELALQELEGPQCAGVVAVAVRTGGDFGRACCRSCMPATTCWSPTAPTDRRAIFADKFCRGSASPPPITIRGIGGAHRRTDPTEHARRLSGIAGLADLRNAGRRRRSPKPRMPRARWC